MGENFEKSKVATRVIPKCSTVESNCECKEIFKSKDAHLMNAMKSNPSTVYKHE